MLHVLCHNLLKICTPSMHLFVGAATNSLINFEYFTCIYSSGTTCGELDATWNPRWHAIPWLVQHLGSSSEQVHNLIEWSAYDEMLIINICDFYFCGYAWKYSLNFCRTKASRPSNNISELLLPRFLDLVIWGHEHECFIDPQVIKHINYIIIKRKGFSHCSLFLHFVFTFNFVTPFNHLLEGGS